MKVLLVLLGLGGGLWLANCAIAPEIAQAETARVHLSLDRQPNETYETLMERAQAAAKAAAQSSFDGNMSVTDVSVIVAAQNHGQIAPVLSLNVSRSQWSSRPDTQPWAKYFASARTLLGFDNAANTTGGQSRTATSSNTFDQTRTYNPASTRRGRYFPSGQQRPGTFITPGQVTNTTFPGQSGNGNFTTPGRNPAGGTTFSPQTPAATSGFPSNTLNQSQPNISPSGVPSNSIPTNGSQTPSSTPRTSGGTTISLPNSSGTFTNINSLGTPTQNQIPNSTIPGTTPNQNVTPGTSR